MKIRRIIALVLMLALLLPAAALGEAAPTEKDKLLIDASNELLSDLFEMLRSEWYVTVNSMSGNLIDIYDEALSFDYTTPKQTLVVSADSAASENIVKLVILMSSEDTDLSEMNPDSLSLMNSRLLDSIPNLFNGQDSVNWLAASSLMNAEDVLQLDGIENTLAFVINRYEGEGQPQTYAAFNIKENGICHVMVGFLKIPELIQDEVLFSGEELSYSYIPELDFMLGDFELRLYDQAELAG